MSKVMVEIFKTSVTEPSLAASVLQALSAKFKGCRANFDLDDCDHILRVELPGEAVPPQAVIAVVNGFGFMAAVLEDMVPSLKSNPSTPADSPKALRQQVGLNQEVTVLSNVLMFPTF